MLPTLETVAPHCLAATAKVDGTNFESWAQYWYCLYNSSCTANFWASGAFSTLASLLRTASLTSGPQAVVVCADAVESCKPNAATPVTITIRATRNEMRDLLT